MYQTLRFSILHVSFARDFALVFVFAALPDANVRSRACGTQSRTEEDAKFQRHVEARQSRLGVGFSTGDIVDTEPTGFNKLEDFLDTDSARPLQI
jgi:hypothetical protein